MLCRHSRRSFRLTLLRRCTSIISTPDNRIVVVDGAVVRELRVVLVNRLERSRRPAYTLWTTLAWVVASPLAIVTELVRCLSLHWLTESLVHVTRGCSTDRVRRMSLLGLRVGIVGHICLGWDVGSVVGLERAICWC